MAIISSRSTIALIDEINAHISDGYKVETMWYEYGWFWAIRYYARMTRVPPLPPPPQPKPYIEFAIGPITNRELPKPPHLEFVIGPIGTKNDL